MADHPYVIRLIEPGWDEDVTAAVFGPFTDGQEVAEALESAGYHRSHPAEDPVQAAWDGKVEVYPLTKGKLPPR